MFKNNKMSPTEVFLPESDTIPSRTTEERIFDIVLKEDDLSWKEMIYDLVKNEHMNPWDVNITLLAERFLENLKKLTQMDFRIGGKIVLASSLLLKLKSDRLVGEDMANFERLLMSPPEEQMDENNGFEFEQTNLSSFLNDQKKLVPRTPQPRERKVSVFDLVDALEKALETDLVKQRKKILFGQRDLEVEASAPHDFFELGKTMDVLHKQISTMLSKSSIQSIKFEDLLSSNDKQSKVYTFIPLLHLENQRKLELLQKEHFGPIEIKNY